MSKPFGSNSFLIIAPNNSLVKHYFLRPPSGEAQPSGFDAMRRSKGAQCSSRRMLYAFDPTAT